MVGIYLPPASLPRTGRQTDRRTRLASLPARRLLDKFGLAFFPRFILFFCKAETVLQISKPCSVPSIQRWPQCPPSRCGTTYIVNYSDVPCSSPKSQPWRNLLYFHHTLSCFPKLLKVAFSPLSTAANAKKWHPKCSDIQDDQDTKKDPWLGHQKGSGKCFSSKDFPPTSLEGGKEDFPLPTGRGVIEG